MTLTPKQRFVARLTARGSTVDECAARLKLGRRQTQRLRALPEVKALVKQLIAEQGDQDAVSVLRDLLLSPSDSVRLGAARALLTIDVSDEELDEDPDDPELSRPHVTVVQRGD